MATDHRERLRSIRAFPQLVKYLRDELDWPISTDDFEDLVFDYSPEELGIDKKNAAKIGKDGIKRLRPLSADQPWGIFFVKFDTQRLPIVALRRILSRVTLKKRASSNPADRAAWETDDLLFVSSYGEESQRHISFAHFHEDKEKKDLPTLKVLGWDGRDTPLHLDSVARELAENLSWPDDEKDAETWRDQWSAAFTLRDRETITTSKNLAKQLAELARGIRDRINTVLAIETEDGPVTQFMQAFKEALVDDLDQDGFADMYAQTIAYGLLSARVENPKGRTADGVTELMPITSPFLKELMETFLDVGGRKKKKGRGVSIDFDELGVNDVVELLDDTNMEAILDDFGSYKADEDPVIHFYEDFLQAYNPKEKKQMGVFYTPRPVVSFIVRSVDELLRTEFGLEDGFADTMSWGEVVKKNKNLKIPKGISARQPFVKILDPSTGTGTFLVEIIDVVSKTMKAKWKAAGNSERKIKTLWNDYVPKQLLPRLHGYELMMAPYAIAHMKIGLKLYETGYRFRSNERACVFLTNALAKPLTDTGTLFPDLDALSVEAASAKESKLISAFTVVLGNPPYSNFSANLSSEARQLVTRYKVIDGVPIVERNALQLERNINDDYVKFLAIAEEYRAISCGIICYITNASFYDAATLRGLRASLLLSTAGIWLYDLGGDPDLSGGAVNQSTDENVFDITQAVAISLFLKTHLASERTEKVNIARLRGNRASKYKVLAKETLASVGLQSIRSTPPEYLFSELSNDAEWRTGFPFNECLATYAEGLKTGLDGGLTAYDPNELSRKIREFSTGDVTYLKKTYGIRDTGWGASLLDNISRTMHVAKEALQSEPFRFQYRPMDFRYMFWPSKLLKAPSITAGRHLFKSNNLCLIAARQVSGPERVTHFFVSRSIPDNRLFYSKKGSATYFPVWNLNGSSSFTQTFQSWLTSSLSTKWDDEPLVGSQQKIGPDDACQFIYAQMHSSIYRERYVQHLKRDWPRVFAPISWDCFSALRSLGLELMGVHLMESAKLDDHITELVGSNDFQVEEVSYSDETVWIDKAKTRGFGGVLEEIWNFHIGGYQVCKKWLQNRQAKGGKNPRPGRVLTDDDIDHYQKIVVALSETIRIMAEIDEVIEEHGGWPDAFQHNQ